MQIATVTTKETGEKAVLSLEEAPVDSDAAYIIESSNKDLVIHGLGLYTKTQAKAWIEELYGDDDYFELEFSK